MRAKPSRIDEAGMSFKYSNNPNMKHRSRSSYAVFNKPKRRMARKRVIAAFLIAGLVTLVVLLGANLENTDVVGPKQSQEGSTEVSLKSLDMESIPGGMELCEFSLSLNAKPEIAESSRRAIEDTLNAFREQGYPVGFVFVNMETGRGIAANVDEVVYGASSIKGPFATYVCESLVDEGEIALSDQARSFDESFRSNGSASVKSLLMGTIEDSSNGMYAGLRRTFDDEAYASWLLEKGIGPNIHADGDLFAWYSARDAAKLWTATYNYLERDTETAAFLEGELIKTKVSFIRDGISRFAESRTAEDTEASFERVTVLNKAGWCATDLSDVGSGSKSSLVIDGEEYKEIDETTLYDSVCDNGIVTIDGKKYVLCVMAGARYSDSVVDLFEELVSSIVATYPSLG